MINAPDIIQSIINQIPSEAKVTSVEGLRLNLCSTLHIVIGKEIEDNYGNKFEVTGMEFNKWIEVSPIGDLPDPFEPSKVIVPKPSFFHGTPQSVNDQITKHESRNILDFMPFIWLVSGYDYEEHGRESSIDCTFNGIIRFLSFSDTKRYSNADHNEFVVKPMQNLAKAFGEVVDNDFNFRTRDTFRYRDRVRFGVDATNKGDTRNILDLDCGGIEGQVELDVYDLEQCSQC